MAGLRSIVLADVKSVQNERTGDREKRVQSARIFVCWVDVVGIATAQVGQSQGFCLSLSVEIPRYVYRSEKYLYFDGALYEVKMLSKAKAPTNLLLNVQALNDEVTKKAVEDWMHENL